MLLAFCAAASGDTSRDAAAWDGESKCEPTDEVEIRARACGFVSEIRTPPLVVTRHRHSASVRDQSAQPRGWNEGGQEFEMREVAMTKVDVLDRQAVPQRETISNRQQATTSGVDGGPLVACLELTSTLLSTSFSSASALQFRGTTGASP